jgi:class 3 adenylate cyclase
LFPKRNDYRIVRKKTNPPICSPNTSIPKGGAIPGTARNEYPELALSIDLQVGSDGAEGAKRCRSDRIESGRGKRPLEPHVQGNLAMAYQPCPIGTSTVDLGPELLELTERLAENAHEVWSAQRLSDGWRLGPFRDDAKKEHPCLIPYSALPESEKVYDRATAVQTLKAIIAIGFQISLPVPTKASQVPPVDQHETIAPSLLDILADRDATPGTILSFWRSSEDQRSSHPPGPEVYERFAQRMLDSGEPLLAYDLVNEGLASYPENVRLRQLLGLALARGGDPVRAGQILARLVEEGHDDEETLGILARTEKDLGLGSIDSDPANGRAYLQRSFLTYEKAYQKTGGTWTGINAATLALVLGDETRAKDLAQRVFDEGLREWEKTKATGKDSYWPMATLGEAALIIGDFDESERWYAQVASLGWEGRRFGNLASTRKQAKLLARYQPGSEGLVDRCFRAPRVVTFAGHMIDRPDRSSPRFPGEIEGNVRLAIRERLERVGALIGYSSASSGSDLLFLEELIARGGEAHVVLPYHRDEFQKDSVEIVSGDGWAERFFSVLDRCEVITASPQKLEVGGISYEFANLIAHGLASLKSRQLDADLVPMAVWDRLPGDGPGGTAASVLRWEGQGYPVDVIDLSLIAKRQVMETTSPSISSQMGSKDIRLDNMSDLGTQIVSILFADVVGFSKLTEEEIPLFVRHFLGLIAEVLLKLPPDSVTKKNTWGDGLYCVFEDIRIAGGFALDLRDKVVATRWEEKGLPAGMNIRIALHAGPVYVCTDPVTEQQNCLGTHVSHAARIEPITPPGQVFASQAFAALAAARRIKEFDCHYVGQTPLAKGHGTYPTYHVHPSAKAPPP